MRLAVYTDYAYHLQDGRPRAERAFALFLAELAQNVDRLVVLGRLHPDSHGGRYDLGDVDYVPMPFYERLTRPVPAIRQMAGSLRLMWRSLDDVDGVWSFGPHPLGIAYALMARLRRKRIVFGVRQEFDAYIRARHPGKRIAIGVGAGLERLLQLLCRRFDVVVVGPAIAAQYARSRNVLEISVSLVREAEISPPATYTARDYAGELTVLSVGRLEAEKNPLALADVLSGLCKADGGDRWRMVICGEGTMEGELRARLSELGVSDRAELTGYVSHDEGLADVYRQSHILLHVSWTEGLPQILFEAFGARLPVVATDVGGIRQAVGDAVLLMAPGDPAQATRQLRRIASDSALRDGLVDAGVADLRGRTLETEAARVAGFITAGAAGRLEAR